MSQELSNVAVMDKTVELPATDVLSNAEKLKTFKTETIENTPVKYDLTVHQRRYFALKRAFDFAISFIALIVLTIPFVVIAIIQKIVSPKEHVFFKQTRIGKNGVPFKLTKFRSMKSSAPHDCPTKDFNEGEQYITRWGRFLRDSSIDELPQLFQVISGKMSLIGPRPLIPQEDNVHRMRNEAGVYQLRPGMTGWAQVNGRDLVSDEEKVKYDVEYMQNVGLKMDIKIILLTIKKVVKKADIEEGNTQQEKELLKDSMVK